MAVGEPPPPSPPHEVTENQPRPHLVFGSFQIQDSIRQPSCVNPNGANHQPPKLHPYPPKPSYADILSGVPTKKIEGSLPNSVSIKVSNIDGGCNGRIQLKPTTTYRGKPAVIFSKSDKQFLIQSMKHVLVAKFSHGKPRLATVKGYFASLNLKSSVNISVYDSKHLILEFEAFEDFVRVWMCKNCMVGGFMMRLFKWREDFHPSFESPIYPVWVHLPGLPLYFYKEDTLMSVANAIGRPLALDLDNINRNKLGCATFCVEADISKDVIDKIWIAFDKLDSCVDKKGFWQNVIFDPLPPYCNRCSHLGHPIDRCLRLDKLISNDVRVEIAEGVGVFEGEPVTGGLQGHGMQLELSAKNDEQNAGLENQDQDKTDDGKPLQDLNGKETEQPLEDHIHRTTEDATSGMCKEDTQDSQIEEGPEHDTHLQRPVDGLSAQGNTQLGCAQNGYEQLVCLGLQIAGEAEQGGLEEGEFLQEAKDDEGAVSEEAQKQDEQGTNLELNSNVTFTAADSVKTEDTPAVPDAKEPAAVAGYLEANADGTISTTRPEQETFMQQLRRITREEKAKNSAEKKAKKAALKLLRKQKRTDSDAGLFQDSSSKKSENMDSSCSKNEVVAAQSQVSAQSWAVLVEEPATGKGELGNAHSEPATGKGELGNAVAEPTTAVSEHDTDHLSTAGTVLDEKQGQEQRVVAKEHAILVEKQGQEKQVTPPKLSSAAAEFTPKWAVLVEELVEDKKRTDPVLIEKEIVPMERLEQAGQVAGNIDFSAFKARMYRLTGKEEYLAKEDNLSHLSFSEDIEDGYDEEREEGDLDERVGSHMLHGKSILSDEMSDIPRPFKIKSAPNSPKGRHSSYDSNTYLLSRRFY